MTEKELLEKRERLKIAIVCDSITIMLDDNGEFLVESSLYEIEDMKECLKNLKKFGYDCIYDEKSKKIIKKKKKEGVNMLVGKIEIKDELIIGDPCYDLDSLELGRIKDVVPGIYNCSIEYSKEKRVSMIEIKHENILKKASDIYTVENEFWIAVDSGQVGFFDFTFYKNYSDNQKNREREIIYNEICNKTLSRDKYGMNSKYFVSSSGYGDGEYDVCIVRNSDRKVIGILIEFIKEAGDDE